MKEQKSDEGMEIIPLTNKNLKRLQKEMMRREKEAYPENIQTSIEDYEEILNSTEAIGGILLIKGEYAGNYISAELDQKEKEAYNLPKNERISYIYNILVIPEQQGRGYAKKLFMKLIEEAKEKGIKKIVGHYREKNSYELIKKMGAETLKEEKNWEETGETYYFCMLAI